jgi:hypothetical protein
VCLDGVKAPVADGLYLDAQVTISAQKTLASELASEVASFNPSTSFQINDFLKALSTVLCSIERPRFI